MASARWGASIGMTGASTATLASGAPGMASARMAPSTTAASGCGGASITSAVDSPEQAATPAVTRVMATTNSRRRTVS